MHLLGDIRSGVVDHHNLRVGRLRHTNVGVGELIGDSLGQHVGPESEVDEAGSGDLWRLAKIGNLELGNYVRGNLPRRLAFGVSQAQRHVRLVVAELWSGGRPKLGVDAGDGLDPATQQCSKGRHRRRLFHCPVQWLTRSTPCSLV